ncbi:MAG: 3-hydroxybutyryl-CoA dehydrogenase [Tabrizicola sp.]|nr:3-hydroxybutyryl-CoA dehydrogenase [Tabrizicola sp.]
MDRIVGVVGLGTMGLGIALVYAQAGFSVLATDSFALARASARDRLVAALAPRLAKGALDQASHAALLARITIVEDIQSFAPASLVIEAIIEEIAAKQALVASLESVLAPDAVIASNTSSLAVAAIAEGAKRPDRILGLHFFNPAQAMKLVELVAHPATAPQALARARDWTATAGKTVIDAPDRPGFIVNRCARPFYGEALAMLEEGRLAGEIDTAILAAGYRIGPFALIDLIGADVNLAATEGLSRAMAGHPRYHVFAALRDQVAKGHLGRKSGQGFIHPGAASPAPADAANIALRIEATLVNEAGWLLAEGGVTSEGIDTALRLGLNFPRGPFEMLATHGASTIRATLAALEALAPPHLKTRYHPAPILEAS